MKDVMKLLFYTCCEVAGTSIENCIRHGHKVHGVVLEICVYTCWNQVANEFKLSFTDQWEDITHQRSFGGVVKVFVHVNQINWHELLDFLSLATTSIRSQW